MIDWDCGSAAGPSISASKMYRPEKSLSLTVIPLWAGAGQAMVRVEMTSIEAQNV
jgi:hypothetical protein